MCFVTGAYCYKNYQGRPGLVVTRGKLSLSLFKGFHFSNRALLSFSFAFLCTKSSQVFSLRLDNFSANRNTKSEIDLKIIVFDLQRFRHYCKEYLCVRTTTRVLCVRNTCGYIMQYAIRNNSTILFANGQVSDFFLCRGKLSQK